MDVPLLITTVRLGCEFDDGMQRDFNVRQISLGQVMEVGVSGLQFQ